MRPANRRGWLVCYDRGPAAHRVTARGAPRRPSLTAGVLGGRVAVRAMISRVGLHASAAPAARTRAGHLPALGDRTRRRGRPPGGAGPAERGRPARAADVLVTSTASGIMPVTVIDGEPVGTGAPGPLTTQLRDRRWGRHED